MLFQHSKKTSYRVKIQENDLPLNWTSTTIIISGWVFVNRWRLNIESFVWFNRHGLVIAVTNIIETQFAESCCEEVPHDHRDEAAAHLCRSILLCLVKSKTNFCKWTFSCSERKGFITKTRWLARLQVLVSSDIATSFPMCIELIDGSLSWSNVSVTCFWWCNSSLWGKKEDEDRFSWDPRANSHWRSNANAFVKF